MGSDWKGIMQRIGVNMQPNGKIMSGAFVYLYNDAGLELETPAAHFYQHIKTIKPCKSNLPKG
jgi:hypothetical protein